MRPEPIPRVLDPRAARMQRAATAWVDGGGDLRGVPVGDVQAAVARRAGLLVRDLSDAEVAKVAREVIAAHVDAEEQRLAEEAVAGRREEERLAYLRRQAERYKFLADEKNR